MSDITGAGQSGRLIQADPEAAAEPDVSMINGRAALPEEAASRRAAILADRDRCNELLSGLVRS